MKFRYNFLLFGILGIVSFIPRLFALEATYYSDAFEGKKTANGAVFSQLFHSAAICNQSLSTYAYVRYGQTGAVVTLNDRPNCTLHSDVIDLSTSVFSLFAPTSRGRLTDVAVTPLAQNALNFPKKTFSEDAFSELSVTLNRPISNTYFAGDSVLIEGRVTDKKEYVMVYLMAESDKTEYSTLQKLDSSGKFSFPFTFPKNPGKYYFVIASGNSFETNAPESLVLLDPALFSYPEIATGSLSLRLNLTDGVTPYIPLPENTWGKMTLMQGKKRYETAGTVLVPPGTLLKTGTASVIVQSALLSTPSSLDTSVSYGTTWKNTVVLDRIHDIIGKSKVNIRTKKGSFAFQFRIGLGERIRPVYYVTLPNGDVREYKFQKKWIGEDGYLIPGSLISASFLARESGVYKLETVLDTGYAHFNIPVYQGNVWSIVQKFTRDERITLETDRKKVESYSIDRINFLRESLGRNTLTLDPDLTQIAQAKSLNMANNAYIGHWTPEGLDILAFATSLGLPHPNTLSENVAGGNVSHMVLQDGLEESGSHRHSMVNPEWTKIGIGYTIKNKKGYLVQVFSRE